MKCTVTITVGHNVNGTHRHETRNVCAQVHGVLHVDAYAAIPCYGMWRGEAEESTRIEIADLGRAEMERIARTVPALAHALQQEAVMCEARPSVVRFIPAVAVGYRTKSVGGSVPVSSPWG